MDKFWDVNFDLASCVPYMAPGNSSGVNVPGVACHVGPPLALYGEVSYWFHSVQNFVAKLLTNLEQ